jgi:subtilisin family serine protease
MEGLNAAPHGGLDALMARSRGEGVRIGLIDGPIAVAHPALAHARIEALAGVPCIAGSHACTHGTFIAAMLVGDPARGVLGACPAATLVHRPIFAGDPVQPARVPLVPAALLAQAIRDVAAAGADVLNLSVGAALVSAAEQQAVAEACDVAAQRGMLIVVASGNQSRMGPSPLFTHEAVIPVVAALADGRPDPTSNLGPTIARRGLLAPGAAQSAVPPDRIGILRGSSVAAAYVSAAAALLCAIFPGAGVERIRSLLLDRDPRWRSIVPPPLDVARSLKLAAASQSSAAWVATRRSR